MKAAKEKKLLFSWVLIGLLCRLIFMPFTLHPDILYIYYHPHFLAFKGVWNIYNYHADFFKERHCHYYAPLTYLFFGSYLYLARPCLSGFEPFMEGIRRVTDSGGGHSGHYLIGAPTERLFRFLFLMKLPYLFFDLGLLGLLVRFNKGSVIGKTAGGESPGATSASLAPASSAIKWWALNPVLIYSCYLFGQFDLIPTFFVVLAAYLAFKGRKSLAMISLGLGAGFKNFPIFLIPPLAIYLGRDMKGVIKYTFLGVLPLVAIVAPYYFLSGGKVMGSFFSDRISGRLGLTGPLGLWRLWLFLSGYLILNLVFLKESVRSRLGELGPVKISFFILAWLFITMPISFHYFTWITPFILILASLLNKRIMTKYYWAVLALGLATLAGKNMWLGLFSPIYPEFFMGLPGLDEIIKRAWPYQLVQKFSILGFILILAWLGLQIWQEKDMAYE